MIGLEDRTKEELIKEGPPLPTISFDINAQIVDENKYICRYQVRISYKNRVLEK